MSSSTATEVTNVERSSVLARAEAAVAARRVAEVALLEAARDWAVAHEPQPEGDPLPDSPEVLFGEQAVALGGPGCPAVLEFAAVELAAVLGVSHEAAEALMADALDLAYRLPRTWALVVAGRVPVRLARLAAAESRDLSLAAVGHADRLLVWRPRLLNPHRVSTLVHEARLYADPDRAVADHDQALADRHVTVLHGGNGGRGAPGTSEVFMRVDTADAVAFDTTIGSLAHQLGALGDPRSTEVRRARAVGVLADPQHALDLLSHDADDPHAALPEERSTAALASTATGSAGRGGVGLVLHVTDRDLLTPSRGRGVVTSDRLGPVLTGVVTSWLANCHVTITPVLDLNIGTQTEADVVAVDRHDPPAAMARLVRLRDSHCVFPGCGRTSARADLDHIDPYIDPSIDPDQGGPPGQTTPANLAPLCRRHHRAKTFGGYDYTRGPDGGYTWSTPTGRAIAGDPPRPRPTPHH